MKNPGTSNNNERTRQRDIGFSDLMRPIQGIRVCDVDPQPICPRCEHYIIAWEVKRQGGDDMYWVMRHTKYTRILADLYKIPAYFVRHHEGEGKLTTVLLAPPFTVKTYTTKEFQAWVEEEARKHRCSPEQLERQKRV